VKKAFSLPKLLPTAAAVLISALPLHAIDTLGLDVAVKSIAAGGPPLVVDDIVLFRYKPEYGGVRFVGARFEHESYAVLHAYSRNEYGVFVLDYRLPDGLREIRYRIVVDGLWMNDPANPDTEADAVGNAISRLRIQKDVPRSILNPELGPGGIAVFSYRGRPGQQISICGDFNDWEPGIHLLSESPGKPGYFTIRLRVKSGDHNYVFYSDGIRILDPFNPQTAMDADGRRVSYFLVP